MFATDRDGAYQEILCVQEQRIVANDNTVPGPLARPTGARHSYAAGSHCI
jgi:hypothetical protein